MPTPTAFVKNKKSPDWAAALAFNRSNCTRPVTASPKIGSGLSMLCPPANGIPASEQMLRPPSRTALAADSGILPRGQPNIAMAMSGCPPIAYMSLIALAAAMRPNVRGSSTIGIKKSVVEMMPVPSPKSITAASSFVSFPIINDGNDSDRSTPERISCKTAGESLHPQPAPWENCVNLMVSIFEYVLGQFGACINPMHAGIGQS